MYLPVCFSKCIGLNLKIQIEFRALLYYWSEQSPPKIYIHLESVNVT